MTRCANAAGAGMTASQLPHVTVDVADHLTEVRS